METSCIENVANMIVMLSIPEPNPPANMTITQTASISVTSKLDLSNRQWECRGYKVQSIEYLCAKTLIILFLSIRQQ